MSTHQCPSTAVALFSAVVVGLPVLNRSLDRVIARRGAAGADDPTSTDADAIAP